MKCLELVWKHTIEAPKSLQPAEFYSLIMNRATATAGAEEEHDEKKNSCYGWTAIIGLLKILNTKAMSKNVIRSMYCAPIKSET